MGKEPRNPNRNLGDYRFGCIAIDRGYVTAEQVQSAIEEMEDDYLTASPLRLLGEILLENHLITEEQVQSILEEMEVGDGPSR